MWGCRSSRPVPAARREEGVSNKHFAPRAMSGLLAGALKGRRLAQEALAGSGKPFFASEMVTSHSHMMWPGKGGVCGICQLGAPRPPCAGSPPDPPGQTEVPAMVRDLGSILTAERSFAGRSHYSPRIPGAFTLPHRSDGTLGRGPRSEPRAPMQMVSGALDSLVFRV